MCVSLYPGSRTKPTVDLHFILESSLLRTSVLDLCFENAFLKYDFKGNVIITES